MFDFILIKPTIVIKLKILKQAKIVKRIEIISLYSKKQKNQHNLKLLMIILKENKKKEWDE